MCLAQHWACNNHFVSGIVDPSPLLQQRLREIDDDFRPRLKAAERRVAEASTRRERRAAKEGHRVVKREHLRARQDAQRLLGGYVAWFTRPGGEKR